MTRVDFYFNAKGRLDTALILVRKAVAQNKRALIFSSDNALLGRIDQLLWVNQPTSFLPHVRATDPLAPMTPVLLASRADEAPHPLDEILFNLDPAPPPHFARFERMIEIVGRDDEADLIAARKRYKFYKDRGYELVTNDLLALSKAAPTGR